MQLVVWRLSLSACLHEITQNNKLRHMSDITDTFNLNQEGERKLICELLAHEIFKGLPEAEHKMWHGSPTWFLNGNPIVAYNALKGSIRLLFWSGQSFNEPNLEPEGSFKAAEVRYTNAADVNSKDVQRWLDKSKTIQWDYKNLIKRKGTLERLK